jgi:hypothetical protein
MAEVLETQLKIIAEQVGGGGWSGAACALCACAARGACCAPAGGYVSARAEGLLAIHPCPPPRKVGPDDHAICALSLRRLTLPAPPAPPLRSAPTTTRSARCRAASTPPSRPRWCTRSWATACTACLSTTGCCATRWGGQGAWWARGMQCVFVDHGLLRCKVGRVCVVVGGCGCACVPGAARWARHALRDCAHPAHAHPFTHARTPSRTRAYRRALTHPFTHARVQTHTYARTQTTTTRRRRSA